MKKRDILCDALGDRMSLINEYANRKAENAKREIILDLFESGMFLEEISSRIKISPDEIKKLIR